MTDGHTEYDLVMPFVVCASKGGPYDDAAFVAGWRAAEIDRRLEEAGDAWLPEVQIVAEPGLLPQIDLIAMRRAYRITATVPTPGAEDEWLHITAVRDDA